MIAPLLALFLALPSSQADARSDYGPDSGSVYILERQSGTWVETAKIVPSGGASGDEFGAAVSLVGETLFVGAPGDSGDAGSVYIYERIGGVWLLNSQVLC